MVKREFCGLDVMRRWVNGRWWKVGVVSIWHNISCMHCRVYIWIYRWFISVMFVCDYVIFLFHLQYFYTVDWMFIAIAYWLKMWNTCTENVHCCVIKMYTVVSWRCALLCIEHVHCCGLEDVSIIQFTSFCNFANFINSPATSVLNCNLNSQTNDIHINNKSCRPLP